MEKQVIIRVDGSTKIGAGHIARCLTLAKELRKRGVGSIFCVKESDEAIINSIREHKFHVFEMDRSISYSQEINWLKENIQSLGNIIILDGYFFDGAYIKKLKAVFKTIMSIDDLAEDYLESDLVLNQNIHATREIYRNKVSEKTKLLLGPKYALLREEFKCFHEKEFSFDSRNLLICFGGADPFNLTLKTIKAIKEIHMDRIIVVLGVSNPYKNRVREYIETVQLKNIEVMENANNMGELMEQADMAIISGGAISWELCCVGVPSVQIIVAENQKKTVEELDKQGIMRSLGWYEQMEEKDIVQEVKMLMENEEERKRMSRKGRAMVDGHGTERVVNEFFEMGLFGEN